MEKEPSKSRQLSARQSAAIDLLLTGKTDIEIAQAIKINRDTLRNWKKSNPYFILEYNKRMNEQSRKTLRPIQDRLASLVDESIKTVYASIKTGDVVSSRWLLDRVSTFPSTITDKFVSLSQPPAEELEDIEAIISVIVDRQITDILKDESISDLDVRARPEVIQKIKVRLMNELKTTYQAKRSSN